MDANYSSKLLSNLDKKGAPLKTKIRNNYSDVVKMNRGHSWEAHKGTACDFKMAPSDKTIREKDMTIIIILEMVSTIMMTLRLKQISKEKDLEFRFHPIEDSIYIPRKRKEFKEMEVEEIVDELKFGLETDMTDAGTATPRLSRAVKRYEDDDEGRCECIAETYFNEISKDKKRDKLIKKKIGKLFAAAMDFLERNKLSCKVYAWSRSQAPTFTNDMSKIQKEAILNRDVFPNFRIGVFTVIGCHENNMAENFMEEDVKITLNRLFSEDNDAFKVSKSNSLDYFAHLSLEKKKG